MRGQPQSDLQRQLPLESSQEGVCRVCGRPSRFGSLCGFHGGQRTEEAATASMEEAHELLTPGERRTRLRRLAREIIEEIGGRHAGFTTQEILQVMDQRGLMEPEDYALDQRWVGPVTSARAFRDEYEAIGTRVQGNRSRNCHKAIRVVWRRRRDP